MDRNGKTPLGLAIVSRANQSINIILSFILNRRLKISRKSRVRIENTLSNPADSEPLIDLAESFDRNGFCIYY